MHISDVLLRLYSLSPFRYTAVKCGHITKRTGLVSVFGETATVKMPLNKDGSLDYCLKCIGKMGIRCAWCGHPIFIGDAVTLYTPHSDFQVPAYAVVFKNDPLQLVGCIRWNCAESGVDRAGFWIPDENGKGKVLRVRSPIEAMMNAVVPSMVVVNNVQDINEALKPTLIPMHEEKEIP